MNSIAIDRRTLVCGAAGAAAVAAVAGVSAAQANESGDIAWDKEVDVVVVGGGTSVVGALKAQADGNQTLIIDKANAIGGTTRLSHGYCWMPDNGLEGSELDSRELSETYLKLIREDAPIEEDEIEY